MCTEVCRQDVQCSIVDKNENKVYQEEDNTNYDKSFYGIKKEGKPTCIEKVRICKTY